MQKMLSLAAGIAALTLSSVAVAQFDGPAPLAWRWQQSSTSVPGGSPLVLGNTIYQSLGGRIFSVDKQSGNLKWRFPAVDPMQGVFRTSPILAEDTLVAACDNKLIVGIDPKTGESKWTTPTTVSVYGDPVAAGKYVIAALSDNTVLALNPSDGTPAWTAPYHIYDGIQGKLAVAGDSVLICTANAKLISFNAVTRHIDWSRQLEQLPPNPSAVVVGDRILVVSGTYMIALNAATGRPIWQIDTRLQIAFPPAISPAGILLVTVDGQAVMYDLDHHLLTKTPITLGSIPISRPTAVGKKFIVETSNGGLILLDPASGKELWNYIIGPVDETVRTTTGTTSGGGGGFGGGAGGKGGPGGGGGFGGQGGSGNSKADDKVYFVQASSPAVLAGQTLLVPVKDGSILAFDKDLGVDLTPPTSELLFPRAGEQVNGLPPLVLLFKVEDSNSGLNKKSIKIDVDGKVLEHTVTKEGLLLIRFSLSGKNPPLPNGRHVFTVTAQDWMGNESKTGFALIIDNTLPPIKIPGQADNANRPGAGGAGGGGGSGDGGGNSG